MTMLSLRVADEEAAEAHGWASALGMGRSELLRFALHRHLIRPAAEEDAARSADSPLSAAEWSLAEVADWGPAGDWSEWADAAR